MQQHKVNIWWGPPRKFTPEFEERRISWLELFYDLVYVIAISRITHHLAEHPYAAGIADYLYLFIMIYWGWLNGSLYHDLHGSPGIRTRLMTLWQMMAVAALIICLGSPAEHVVFRTTIALMVLQVYITYLWWSVGIYDKHHRQYNIPYTICYLLGTGLLFMSLFVEAPYQRLLFWITVILCFIPPFIVIPRLRRNNEDFSMSPSMTERLGLFTIIIFGEAVLGVIQGTVRSHDLNFQVWINFALGILIVFALWWIFFALLTDREARPGFLNSHIICMSYIPMLAALGMVGASSSGVLHGHSHEAGEHSSWIPYIYGTCLCIFLMGIAFITYFLHFPEEFDRVKRLVRRLLMLTGMSILVLTVFHEWLSLFVYLFLVFLALLSVVVVITKIWFRAELKKYAAGGQQ